MNDDQVIAIIKMLKSLRQIEFIHNNKNLYVNLKEKATGFKIVGGTEMNKCNIDYPDRYMLLRTLENDTYIVEDFGDFPKSYLEQCLYYFKVNSAMTEVYADIIFDFINDAVHWLTISGNEILMDLKTFKLVPKPNNISN